MIYIAFDPGISGGLCVIEEDIKVLSLPVKKRANSNKKEYDTLAIVNELKKYSHKEATVAIEDVHTMPNQGVSSSGNLMEGKGILIGIATALFGQLPRLIQPQAWKKSFPELQNLDELIALKESIKQAKSNNQKKLATKLNSEYKKKVKNRTRELASEYYPKIKSEFKKVKDDGKADALFIALHLKQLMETEEQS